MLTKHLIIKRPRRLNKILRSSFADLVLRKPCETIGFRYGRRQSHVLRERQKQQTAETSDPPVGKPSELIQPSSSRCSERSSRSNATDEPIYCQVKDDLTKSLTPTPSTPTRKQLVEGGFQSPIKLVFSGPNSLGFTGQNSFGKGSAGQNSFGKSSVACGLSNR